MPVTTPASCSLSSASETAQASRRPRRATVSSITSIVASGFSRTSLPVRETHRVAGSRLGPIARHVVDLVIFQTGSVHRRDHWIPVLDLGCADLEVALGELRERILIAARHGREHLA